MRKQGRLSEQAAERLGFPHLAQRVVEYEPHPTERGFAKAVYYGERKLGGIVLLGERGIIEIDQQQGVDREPLGLAYSWESHEKPKADDPVHIQSLIDDLFQE